MNMYTTRDSTIINACDSFVNEFNSLARQVKEKYNLRVIGGFLDITKPVVHLSGECGSFLKFALLEGNCCETRELIANREYATEAGGIRFIFLEKL